MPISLAKAVWNDWCYCVDCHTAYRVRLADPAPETVKMKLVEDPEED